MTYDDQCGHVHDIEIQKIPVWSMAVKSHALPIEDDLALVYETTDVETLCYEMGLAKEPDDCTDLTLARANAGNALKLGLWRFVHDRIPVEDMGVSE